MIQTRQLVLITCLTALAGGSLTGCAASAIGDPDLETANDDALANEDPPTDAGEEEDDPPPTTKRDASVPPKDSGAPTATDSGAKDAGSPQDAGTVDAGAKDAGSTPKDAGTPVVDAGSTPKDAGTPVVDAGKPADPPPSNNQCSKDSDCTNLCIAVGILPCCTIANTCGCTWAPGAYCL